MTTLYMFGRSAANRLPRKFDWKYPEYARSVRSAYRLMRRQGMSADLARLAVIVLLSAGKAAA